MKSTRPLNTSEGRHAVRPVYGVAGELALFSVLLGLLPNVRGPSAFSALLLLAAQVLAGFLIHCPAHYIVGRLLGISFREMRLGRTTLARALPSRVRGTAGMILVLSLSVDRESKARAGARRTEAMYLAGASASLASSVGFAMLATVDWGAIAALVTWAYALFYSVTEVLFSTKSGDLARARVAGRAMRL